MAGADLLVVMIIDVEVIVPPALDRYLVIKREFMGMAKVEANRVLLKTAKYDIDDARKMSRRGSLVEGVCLLGKKLGLDALSCVVEKAVSTLASRGCYSIDEARYSEEYLDPSVIDECARSGIFVTALEEVEQEETEREESRRDRLECWGDRWIGGTICGGLKSAIKGAIQARILDDGGALAAKAVNGIGRMRSRKKVAADASVLFELFCSELSVAVHDAILENVDGYVRCLVENLNEDIDSSWPGRDSTAALGILGNLNAGRIPKSRRRSAIAEMLRLDPLCSDAYRWVYSNEPSMRKDIEALSERFCVEVAAIEEARQQKEMEARQRAQRQAERRKAARQAARAADEGKRRVFGKVWPSVEEMESARSNRDCFIAGVESLVAKYNGLDGYAGNRLTEKKLSKIRTAFKTLPGERVIWLLDTSSWYTADYGLVVTDRGVRWRNRDSEMSKKCCLDWFDFGATDKSPRVTGDGILRFGRCVKVDMDVNINWKEKWLPIIVSMWSFWREGAFQKSHDLMSANTDGFGVFGEATDRG